MSELTWTSAVSMASTAVKAGAEAERNVAVVVLDATGTELAVLRHHDAYLSGPAIARAKAFTALNFRTPTAAMAERLGSIEYAMQISMADPRLAIIKGGVPLRADGVIVGAIGVSGASGDEDAEFAQRAAESAGFSS